MEAEENDSSKHDQPSSPLLSVDDGNDLDVKCHTHRELHSNEEQHCLFQSAINELEFPSNSSVESLQPSDAIRGDESLVAETCLEVEETEIAGVKACRNGIEDMGEDSVKLEVEPDIAAMGLLGETVFNDVKEEDAGAEEVKAVAEFGEGDLLCEMDLVGGAENQVEGNVLMVNLPDNTVGCGETDTCLSDVLAELAETTPFVHGVDTTDAANLVEKKEVEENGDDPKDSKDIEVAKQETFSMEDGKLGVPVQLVEKSELKQSLVDGAVVEEERTENLADRTGETLKMENESSNTDEVGLANFAGEIDGAVTMENTEDKTVEVDGMCLEDKAADATTKTTTGNLADETPEIKGVHVTDDNIEVLKIENVEDREAGVQGLGVADESAEVGKIENLVDETAEAENVTNYTAESMENLDDKTAQLEEIAMEEETEEADDRVYLVDEGIGSEENDANMTYLVGETEAAEEVEEMDVTEEVDEASKGSSGAKRKRGKNSKAPARVPSRKKVEEDVCFICFDGGDLVLCDRRFVFSVAS